MEGPRIHRLLKNSIGCTGRVERALRDCVATSNAIFWWDNMIESRASQPRSGGIAVSPGRKPWVKWKKDRAAEPGSPLRAALARNGAEERRHKSRHSLFRSRVQALYFCHPERTSVREGSAFPTFSAACSAVPSRAVQELGFSP